MTEDPGLHVEHELDVEKLIRETADRVATVVLASSAVGPDRDRQAIVDRAVRDAVVDRDLRDHARHLAEINGSQAKMAQSLKAVEGSVDRISASFDKQLAVTEAIGRFVEKERGVGINRRVVWVGLAAAIAAYGSIVAILVAH